MGARSRRKGSRIEREVARVFQEHLGGTWSRVPLSGGWGNRAEFATCGDLVATLPDFPFTVECKAVEGWHLEQLLTSPKNMLADWWRQTCAEAVEAGKKPLLVLTRNFQPLFAMVAVEELGDLRSGGVAAGLVGKVGSDRVVVLLLRDFLTCFRGCSAAAALAGGTAS